MQRIWELDALRGVCILGVIGMHALFDLTFFFAVPISQGMLLTAIGRYGGILFVLLSGICVTLGRHSIRRGCQLLLCAMGITAVTAAMAALGLANSAVVIRFGVLHLLGCAMVLWPMFRGLSDRWLTVLGIGMVLLGIRCSCITVPIPWLFPLGLTCPGFTSADYFPLLPHLGWFLLGAVLGRHVYGNRHSRLPDWPARSRLLRFFTACGRNSLWIYLLHQPVLCGLLWVVTLKK